MTVANDTPTRTYTHRISIEVGAFTGSDERMDPLVVTWVADSFLLGTATPELLPGSLRMYSSNSDGSPMDDVIILIWIQNFIFMTLPMLGRNPIIKGIYESLAFYLQFQLDKYFRDVHPPFNKYSDN